MTSAQQALARQTYLAGQSVAAITLSLNTPGIDPAVTQAQVVSYLQGLGLTVPTASAANTAYLVTILFDASAGLSQRTFQFAVAQDSKAHALSVLSSILAYQNYGSYSVLYVQDQNGNIV
jgi:uncharacterized protein (DUF2141 family)